MGRLIERFASRSDPASAVPYVRLVSFLGDAIAAELFAELLARHGDFRRRGQRAPGRSTFLRLAPALAPRPVFVDRLVAAAPHLEQRFGVDLRAMEVELTAQAYDKGTSFARHRDVDAGGPNWQRRLSGVYYLHSRPRRFAGGELVVYDRRAHPHAVAPDHDVAVFFPSTASHEVLPVTMTSDRFEDCRFGINIWIS
jgi:SM-20-related protein